MEPECSLPYSQDPVNSPYSEPDASNPHQTCSPPMHAKQNTRLSTPHIFDYVDLCPSN